VINSCASRFDAKDKLTPNMRTRPPDGPPVLTDREVASSNTTLNAFLGGRQKSWMTGTGTNVRPTPRAQVTQRYVNVDIDTLMLCDGFGWPLDS
jgi:hypothetical protein